ncbi:Transcription factor TFIIE beta subunit DNA-binding domain [Arabidopsis thaliana x Arabidopsis arenosa]|uniref:Transcription factor TFIIE beta subunit DNA-binding domain n=1 Tax=Arabidopsis thaliana x Arabidopsis arenosa TaxID=1240361 RepID=A0A8T1Y3M1_9BRAS|nr:Transcription factor TFIIE beta subunit DNA-binding domain [Arabidopsis thaliana x Arabidopsis arenosa]
MGLGFNQQNYSDDTERLQIIDSIREAPVGAQIKRVIDLLIERRLALTTEQINEECYVDMHSNKAVFDSLSENPKVNYDGTWFSYKAT